MGICEVSSYVKYRIHNHHCSGNAVGDLPDATQARDSITSGFYKICIYLQKDGSVTKRIQIPYWI